jgi:hypothetical protein
LEKVDKQVVEYLDVLRKGGLIWIFNNFKRLMPPNDRDAVVSAKNF